MGEGLRRLNVARHKLVVSTKIFWGAREKIPNYKGLSRKHVIEGTKRSLKNLGLDYVDIIFCHRHDSHTPVEETCKAFDWLVRKGYTLYWGTSMGSVDDIAEAHMVCEKYGLVKPVAEQCEYNLYNRNKMENEFRNYFQNKKLGTTIFSPLLMGILTGKYNDGIPDESRFSNKDDPVNARMIKKYLVDRKDQTLESLQMFKKLAEELGCSMAQLAMAWCINNPDVSTAITGASSPKQLEDTFKAIRVRKLLTPEIESRIEKIFKTAPQGKLYFITGKVLKSRRFETLGYE